MKVAIAVAAILLLYLAATGKAGAVVRAIRGSAAPAVSVSR